jgi:calcineurin-like phosphoesterase family protein
MRNEFVTADLHWNHKGMTTFNGAYGTKLRPWDNVEEMNEALITNWNSVVKPEDKVYVLGDVALTKVGLAMIGRCNGTKILTKGNHDQESIKDYVNYFQDVRGIHKKGDYVFSHVPIHPDSLGERWSTNVHGHLHDGRVLLPDGSIDKRYICVSVEHSKFTPIPVEEIEKYR